MVNEFVNGPRFGSPRIRRIVPAVAKLCDRARAAGIPVFYTRDAHTPSDPEMRVWGRHAMAGTTASAIVQGLEPRRGEMVYDKKQYSGFQYTGLERALKRRGVDAIYFAGVATEICVQHNVADAFYRGYRTYVVRECVESFDAGVKAKALKYMATMYGSNIVGIERVKF